MLGEVAVDFHSPILCNLMVDKVEIITEKVMARSSPIVGQVEYGTVDHVAGVGAHGEGVAG